MTLTSPPTLLPTALPGRPLVAAAWMSGSVASFTIMAVAGRELAAELSTFEVMAYRSVIGLGIVIAAIAFLSRRGFGQIRTPQPWLHAVRNVIHFSAQNMWLYAVATIPLAQVMALESTNPIWVALLAPLVLGERFTRPRMIAALLGCVGILIIARPGVSPLELGHLAALGCALGFAANTMTTKRLSRTDSTLCILFWMTLSQAAMGFAIAVPAGLSWFSWGLAPWVVAVGLCGLSAHYCLTSALAAAPATVVAPMEFLRLPLIAVVGMWLYGEPLEVAVFVGGMLVLAGNLINIRAERRGRRDAAPTEAV